MGYRDRMKKPEIPDVGFEVNADYANVKGVMSALEEDEGVSNEANYSNYRQDAEGNSNEKSKIDSDDEKQGEASDD